MKLLSLFALFFSLHAQAGCLEDAGRQLVSCRNACLSGWTEIGRAACAAQCNADYYAAKRACGSSEAPLAQAAFLADDGGCKQMTSESDGRTRFLCMADGAVYDTYGQCRWYCR